MKRILVPIDGSATSIKALDAAVALAKLTGGSITVFKVVIDHFQGFSTSAGLGTTRAIVIERQNAAEAEETESKKFLADLVNKYSDSGINFDYKVSTGIVEDQIGKMAEQGEYDLIVIGRRGLNPLKRIFVGSVTQRVIADAPCSVLVIKED